MLALEEDQEAAHVSGEALHVRACGPDGFEAGDRLSLVWLPTAGLPKPGLRRAVQACASALVPGGWLVLPVPLVPRRRLGEAAAHLVHELEGTVVSARSCGLEDLLWEAGLGHVRTVWEDAVLGIRLVAARRP